MKANREKKNFTLVEVILSILIISLIAAASYFSFVILQRAVEDAHNRSLAVALALKSEEELRRIAQSNFDSLDSPTIQNNFNSFSDPVNFPQFTRTLSVFPLSGSTEIKKVEVKISWNERGKTRNYIYSFLLSRPPLPLPADICGRVVDKNTHNPVNGVTVKITCATKPSFSYEHITGTVGCSGVDCSSGGCYTFANVNPTTGTRTFNLYPNECNIWNLSVLESSKYYKYDHPNPITIFSGRETQVPDIYLNPKPQAAHIRVSVIDKESGNPLATLLSLYQEGIRKSDKDKWAPADWKIEFEEGVSNKCFTVVTGYKDYYYPYRYNNHCGDFCDPEGWGKNYNYRGWSSAVVQEDESVICGNPWEGSKATDRICVTYGDTVNITIPLVKVPTATLKGYIKTEGGEKVTNATIKVYWHSGGGWASTNSDSDGYYQIEIPAAQELFPNDSDYYLTVKVCGKVGQGCCDKEINSCKTWWKKIGPVWKDDVINKDFVLPGTTQNCGDVKGYIYDGKTGNPVSGARVAIRGVSKNSDNNGFYYFKCEDSCPCKPGGSTPSYKCCRLPTGNTDVWVKKEGEYYPFSSHYGSRYDTVDGIKLYSRDFYNQSSIPEVNILNKHTVSYDVNLWPIGRGKIIGHVKDASTDSDIKGAKITLTLQAGIGSKSTITDENGNFEFDNVFESWPPPDLPDTPYYNHTTRNHSLKVEASGYEKTEIKDIKLNDGQSLNLGNISLIPSGGM
ncbi:MAG: hypothetical protein B6D56_06150 [Candidatus Omnitrophica bacterium 4484_70.1]|nr:MAG: hypothetical protein B6D56_06150 [Candidatus Omnitrophica bacterium 4484_70.1]